MKDEAHPMGRRARYLSAALAGYLAVFIFPAAAQAQLGWEGRMQMGFGGDELATVEYSDGTSSDLTLGTHFSVAIGPAFEAWTSGRHSVELLGLLGAAVWETGPQNTDDRLRLTRFPAELLAFYGYSMPERNILLRFGGGMTSHLGGGVSGTGALEDTDVDLANASGPTFETSVVFGRMALGLRYTNMSVTIDGESFDESSFGIYFGIALDRN